MSSKPERNQVSRLFRCWEFYRALSTAFFSILQSYELPPSSLPSPPRQAVQIDGTHLIIWHSCLLGGDTQWSLSWLMFLKCQGHVFSTGTGTEGGQDGTHWWWSNNTNPKDYLFSQSYTHELKFREFRRLAEVTQPGRRGITMRIQAPLQCNSSLASSGGGSPDTTKIYPSLPCPPHTRYRDGSLSTRTVWLP